MFSRIESVNDDDVTFVFGLFCIQCLQFFSFDAPSIISACHVAC